MQPVRLGSVVEQPEQHEELRPGAVALVHRVGMEGRVLAQPLVEAGERVVAREGLSLGQQVPLLGVEQEDEPQDDGEQRVVDVVGTLGQRLAQQFTVRCVVGRLDAAQQLVERVQHLLGQAARSPRSGSAGCRRGAPRSACRAAGSEAGSAQQQPQRGNDRPAGGGDHVGHVQVEPAGALAARRGHETE